MVVKQQEQILNVHPIFTTLNALHSFVKYQILSDKSPYVRMSS